MRSVLLVTLSLASCAGTHSQAIAPDVRKVACSSVASCYHNAEFACGSTFDVLELSTEIEPSRNRRSEAEADSKQSSITVRCLAPKL